MNKKIVGIFVCMLIITPIAIVTGDTEKKTMDTSVDNKSDIIVYEINDANPSGRLVYSEYNTNGFFDYILDQKQVLNTGSERIQAISGGLAQSFTPSMSPLSKVAILYTKSSGIPEFANYYLEIRADIHSSSYLRKIQITSSELPSGNIWLTWTLSDLAVTIGSSYWIVVYA